VAVLQELVSVSNLANSPAYAGLAYGNGSTVTITLTTQIQNLVTYYFLIKKL
jgi:hypothetical protein